jgi:hypothetical protein
LTGVTGADLQKCWWNKGATGTPVYLIGDSNADHFSEALISASRSRHEAFWTFSAANCVPLARTAFKSSENVSFTHCPAYVSRVLKWLSKAKPGIVVMSSYDMVWWDRNIKSKFANGSWHSGEKQKLGDFGNSFAATVKRLRADGHTIVTVATVPQFRSPGTPWDPTACSFVRLISESCFQRRVAVAEIRKIQGPSWSALAHAARLSGSAYLDLTSKFCGYRWCSTTVGGTLAYRDDHHITVGESNKLAYEFEKVLDLASR